MSIEELNMKRKMELTLGNDVETKFFDFRTALEKLDFFYSRTEMKEKELKCKDVLSRLEDIKEILEWM